MPLIERISGSSSSYSLKHRAFNGLLFCGVIIAALDWSITSFVILKNPVLLHAFSVGLLLISYYFARSKRVFSPVFISVVAIGLISVLDDGLLLNSGSENKALPELICSVIVFFLCAESVLPIVVAALHVLGLAVLLSLKFMFPEWVINHYIGTERF